MKFKVISAALIFCFLLGCNSNTGSNVTVNLRSISFTTDIVYYNENYTADCIIDSGGTFVAMLTSPENLLGLTVEYNGDAYKLKYNGIKISNAESFLPENSAISLLRFILANAQNLTPVKNDKNYEIKGKYLGKDYTLIIAPTGLPILLKLPDFGLTVSFKKVSLI